MSMKPKEGTPLESQGIGRDQLGEGNGRADSVVPDEAGAGAAAMTPTRSCHLIFA